MRPIPVAESLFVTEPGLRLIGGRHRQTRKFAFPLPDSPDYERIELPPRGVLWSYTIQRFAPKSPPYRFATPFTPFAVGYVALPDALIVEGRLTGASFETLRVGMPMQLTTIEFGQSGQDGPVQAYAFKPLDGAAV